MLSRRVQVFWNTNAQKGECCGGLSGVEYEYKCSCQAKEIQFPAPICKSKITTSNEPQLNIFAS